DALKLGEVEAAAKGFWDQNLAKFLPVVKLAENQAKTVDGRLKKFVTTHGTTEFSQSVGDGIAVLQRKIAEATGGRELAALRKIFKGQVVSVDPETLKVELSYDFSHAAQLEDWMFKAGHPSNYCRVENGRAKTYGLGVGLILKSPITLESVSFDVAAEPAKMIQFGVNGHAVAALNPSESFLSGEFGVRGLAGARRGGPPIREGENSLALSVSGKRGTLTVNGKKLAGNVGKLRRDFLVLKLWWTCRVDNVRVIGNLDRGWLEHTLKLGEMPKLEVRDRPSEESRRDEQDRRRQEAQEKRKAQAAQAAQRKRKQR
ncbi:hypothetical protein ACFL01_02140, partial [Planctomycetota bacterium]